MSDQRVGDRELFGNVMIKPPEEFGRVAGPDGMAFDREGYLYVGVLQQGDITVLAPGGSVKTRLSIPGTFPTNLAFDQSGKPQILVTEGSGNQLLKLDVSISGCPLFAPKK
jgi:gluconolactonase